MLISKFDGLTEQYGHSKQGPRFVYESVHFNRKPHGLTVGALTYSELNGSETSANLRTQGADGPQGWLNLYTDPSI